MDTSDPVVGRRLQFEIGDVDRWCRTYLGAGIDAVLFCDGHLSTVLGVELTSGEQIVVKVRTGADRLRGCAAVHRRLFERGFPSPEPIVDLEPMDGLVASAEAMVRGGNVYPRSGRSPAPFASALAQLVSLAPHVAEVCSLEPPPPWTAPDLGAAVLWPAPDDRDLDLNSIGGPEWIDEAGRAAKTRLAASDSPLVVGHADWYTGNLRWRGDDLHAVWDWDSVIAASEPALAGLAAAVYPAKAAGTEATVEESEAFLDAYQHAREPFSDDELAEAWAAGLWNRSFDAKKQLATDGEPRSLTEAEAIERQRRVIGP
jgi:Phosphotransferase enzyme family